MNEGKQAVHLLMSSRDVVRQRVTQDIGHFIVGVSFDTPTNPILASLGRDGTRRSCKEEHNDDDHGDSRARSISVPFHMESVESYSRTLDRSAGELLLVVFTERSEPPSSRSTYRVEREGWNTRGNGCPYRKATDRKCFQYHLRLLDNGDHIGFLCARHWMVSQDSGCHIEVREFVMSWCQ